MLCLCPLYASAGTNLQVYYDFGSVGTACANQRSNRVTTTLELFYPDARLIYDRMAATGIHAEFHEGRGLNHNFPLYPTPEAARALDAIISAVTED